MIEAIKTGINYGFVGIGTVGTFIIGLLAIGVLANAVEAVKKADIQCRQIQRR